MEIIISLSTRYIVYTEREREDLLQRKNKSRSAREANKAGGSNEPHVSAYSNNRPNCYPYFFWKRNYLFKNFLLLSEINPDIRIGT